MTTVTEIMQATVGVESRSKRPPMWSLCKVVVRAPLAALFTAAIAAGGAAGCTADGDDVKPDKGRFFFPTGAAMSPDGMWLFVANANSDLTFDSGAISVVSIRPVEDVVTAWLSSGLSAIPTDSCNDDDPKTSGSDDVVTACCERDADFTETLVCNERMFLEQTENAGVRIGNFATDLAVQDRGDGKLRLVVPTRGDPSIAWADWEDGKLTCDGENPAESFQLCDDAHRLSFAFSDDEADALPDEPFGVFADSAGEFAIVTHLTSGSVTLIDSPRGGSALITDIQKNVFEADPTSGLRGSTGVAGRKPDAPGDIIYVGSRSEDKIQTFTVGRPVNLAPPFLLQGSWFFLNGVGNNSNTNSFSSDTRGMAFSSSGNRLYLLNRKPPTLQILDTSFGPTGVPLNQLVGAVDICRQASTVTVAGTGDNERAYLTCFQDGQIYVVDPRGRGHVEDVITVGRGPYSVAAAPDGRRLYVTNFLEDTIAVIDLTPGSPTRHRVVLRLGVPRPL